MEIKSFKVDGRELIEQPPKPCPFCGGEATVEFGQKVWSVFCANLPRSGYIGGCLVEAAASACDKEQAISRWNRRKGAINGK